MKIGCVLLGGLLVAALVLAMPFAAAMKDTYVQPRTPLRSSSTYVPYSAAAPAYTAYPMYSGYSRPSSTFSSTTKYQESPGFTRGAAQTFRQNSASNEAFSDFDSSSAGYDYRGPMFERQIVNREDFAKDSSSRSGLFSAKSSDSLHHSISTMITEKYLGATESLTTNSQNRRSSSKKSNEQASADVDEGFSYGKQRVFDASEYGKDSYTQPSYYRPMYNDNKGYYTWRY